MSADRHEAREVAPGVVMSQPRSAWLETERRNNAHLGIKEAPEPVVETPAVDTPEVTPIEAGSLTASNTVDNLPQTGAVQADDAVPPQADSVDPLDTDEVVGGEA